MSARRGGPNAGAASSPISASTRVRRDWKMQLVSNRYQNRGFLSNPGGSQGPFKRISGVVPTKKEVLNSWRGISNGRRQARGKDLRAHRAQPRGCAPSPSGESLPLGELDALLA